MSQDNNFLEKVAGAPADILDKTLDTSKKIGEAFVSPKRITQAKEYWKTLGPGLTTGAADDDPSGIATYSQAGAQFGFNLLWMAPFTFPSWPLFKKCAPRLAW